MVVAAETIDTPPGQTLRLQGARRAVVVLAKAAPITRPGVTFLVRIGVVLDVPTRSIAALTFFRRRAGQTGSRARGIATDAVDTIAGRAFRRRSTGRTIGQIHRNLARSCAITIAVHAFVVGIGAGNDRAARAVAALALFRRRAGQARIVARAGTTHAVDTETRCALSSRNTSRTIGQKLLRGIADARAGTFAVRAFIVGIGVGRNESTNAVVARTFFRRRTRRTRAGAHIVATETIDAIIRETFGAAHAREAIVVFARAASRTRSAITFFVGILIVSDGTTDAVDAATFFSRRARHTRSGTSIFATHAIDTRVRCALRPRHARRSIRLRRLRLIARASSSAFPGIAFIVGIFAGSNGSTDAIVPLTLTRFRTRITLLIADVSAAKTVYAIVGQTLRFARTRDAIVLLADAFTVA